MRSGQQRELHAWAGSALQRAWPEHTASPFQRACVLERAPVPHTAYGGEAQLGAGAHGVVTADWVQHSLRCGRLQRCVAVSADAARGLSAPRGASLQACPRAERPVARRLDQGIFFNELLEALCVIPCRERLPRSLARLRPAAPAARRG